MKTGIYTTSKISEAARWIDLREGGWPIISTWIDEGNADEIADMADLWTRCIKEASECAALVAFHRPGDVFKGSWCEVGAALAHGIPVYGVGIEKYTIAAHPGVMICPNLDTALSLAMRQHESATRHSKH